MAVLYIPSGAGNVGRDDVSSDPVFGGPRHYVCGLLGFVVAAGTLTLSYSLVVSVASAVPLLSTTAVTFVGIVLWVLAWLALDAVVFWASGRGPPDRRR